MFTQTYDYPEIDIKKVVGIIRSHINGNYIGRYYEKILFASVLFELGVECEIKFGDARIEEPQKFELKILPDDSESYHCWIEVYDDIIDLTLGIKTTCYMFHRNALLCFDVIEIADKRNCTLKLGGFHFTYKPLSIKNGKKLVGNNFCKSNMTLYKDLDAGYEFIELAKELAHKYRLAVNRE